MSWPSKRRIDRPPPPQHVHASSSSYRWDPVAKMTLHMRFARFLVCSLVKKTAYRIAQRISCVHYYHLAVFADPTVLALLCHFCCVHLALSAPLCSPVPISLYCPPSLPMRALQLCYLSSYECLQVIVSPASREPTHRTRFFDPGIDCRREQNVQNL